MTILLWPKSPRLPARVRLAVEQLEDRAVPAATFTVTTLAPFDSGSLRQAVLAANADPASADTIVFQPGLSGTITLSGQLDITGPVTIQGPGAGVITVSGGDASRIFSVDDGKDGAINVTISGLTLTHGNAGTKAGGAIMAADEALTLSGVAVVTNKAARGGAIFAGGGAFDDKGSVTIENCTITGNQSLTGFGGGLLIDNSATLIRNSTIAGNQAHTDSGFGAGISFFNGTSLTVENTAVSANQSDAGGGGIHFAAGASLVVRNSTFSGNRSAFG